MPATPPATFAPGTRVRIVIPGIVRTPQAIVVAHVGSHVYVRSYGKLATRSYPARYVVAA